MKSLSNNGNRRENVSINTYQSIMDGTIRELKLLDYDNLKVGKYVIVRETFKQALSNDNIENGYSNTATGRSRALLIDTIRSTTEALGKHEYKIITWK